MFFIVLRAWTCDWFDRLSWFDRLTNRGAWVTKKTHPGSDAFFCVRIFLNGWLYQIAAVELSAAVCRLSGTRGKKLNPALSSMLSIVVLNLGVEPLL